MERPFSGTYTKCQLILMLKRENRGLKNNYNRKKLLTMDLNKVIKTNILT